MATLVEQRKELKKTVKAYETMVDDIMTYLHSSKFNKFQESSPNQLCNNVNVEDILRRLDVSKYEIENSIELNDRVTILVECMASTSIPSEALGLHDDLNYLPCLTDSQPIYDIVKGQSGKVVAIHNWQNGTINVVIEMQLEEMTHDKKAYSILSIDRVKLT